MFASLSSRVMLAVFVVIVGAVLGGAGWASHRGVGAQTIGQPDHRAGSVIGPRVLGGGPRTGK